MINKKTEIVAGLIEKINLKKEDLGKIKASLDSKKEAEKTIKKIIIPRLNNIKNNFTVADFVDFFKQYFSSKELNSEELENASGGSLGGIGAVALSIADTAASLGLASTPNAINKTATDLRESLSSKKDNINKENIKKNKIFLNLKERKENNGKEFSIGNIKLKEEPKFTVSKKNTENGNLKSTDYKIFKIGNIEEERALLLKDQKDFIIKDTPLMLEGNYLPTGKATYSATVVFLENNTDINFDEKKWEKISTKDGKKILVYKDSEAYKKLSNLFNKK